MTIIAQTKAAEAAPFTATPQSPTDTPEPEITASQPLMQMEPHQ